MYGLEMGRYLSSAAVGENVDQTCSDISSSAINTIYHPILSTQYKSPIHAPRSEAHPVAQPPPRTIALRPRKPTRRKQGNKSLKDQVRKGAVYVATPTLSLVNDFIIHLHLPKASFSPRLKVPNYTRIYIGVRHQPISSRISFHRISFHLFSLSSPVLETTMGCGSSKPAHGYQNSRHHRGGHAAAVAGRGAHHHGGDNRGHHRGGAHHRGDGHHTGHKAGHHAGHGGGHHGGHHGVSTRKTCRVLTVRLD